MRRRDGEDYEPSSLRCLCSSIERHLKKNNYTKIINDKEFELFRKFLQAKLASKLAKTPMSLLDGAVVSGGQFTISINALQTTSPTTIQTRRYVTETTESR